MSVGNFMFQSFISKSGIAITLPVRFRSQAWRSWFDEQVEEPLAGRIRAEQIAAIMRLSPIAMMANIFSAVAIAWSFWSDPIKLPLTIWAGLIIGVSGLGLASWHSGIRRGKATFASLRAIRVLMRNAAVIAVLWSAGSVVLFHIAAEPQQRLLIASLITGLICGGGFGLAAVAPASLIYIGILVASNFVSLILTGQPLFYLLSALLLIYTAMLAFSVAWQARLFVTRLIDQDEVRRQKEVVSLVLNEFEENASDWLWETDHANRLQHVSPRFAEAVRSDPEQLREINFFSLLNGTVEANGAEQLGELTELFAARIPFRDVTVAIIVAGERRWWSLSGRPVFDDRGTFQGYRGVGADVTAAHEVEVRIRHMAMHDSLTDLPNRTCLRERMQQLLKQLDSAQGIAVLFLDLDRFKAVNDTLGHPIGDSLLRQVAARLRECVDAADIVGRLGGDEFAIVQVAHDPVQAASSLAERLLRELTVPFDLGSHQVMIGTSIGIAVVPEDGSDPDQLLKRADLALYAAKEQGRGAYRFFAPDMDEKVQARRWLEEALRHALDQNQFEVFYQPLVHGQSGQVRGCEALLRWRLPDRGMVPPVEFIPLAEETGLINRIGDWVLNQACADATRWPDHVSVAVNLSPVQFKQPNLVDAVTRALDRTGLDPVRLELEITESVLLDDDEATLATLHRLRALGVRVALDDFGTGFASLGYLCRFPFDKIKIDRSFIKGIASDQTSQAIVQAIVTMASSLGMRTTAEGVEAEEQQLLLRLIGCTELQGYLFSRPRPRREIEARLAVRTESLSEIA